MSAPLICAATWVLTIGRIESYRPVHKGSGMSDSESEEPPVRLEEKVEEAGGTLADLHKAFGHHLRREESGESASEEEAWATAAVSEGAPRFRSSAACPRSPRSHYARTREDQVSGEGGNEVSSLGNLLDVPHDRMVSGNKDEPADAHLVDALCESEERGVRRRRWERRGREAGVLSERLSAV